MPWTLAQVKLGDEEVEQMRRIVMKLEIKVEALEKLLFSIDDKKEDAMQRIRDIRTLMTEVRGVGDTRTLTVQLRGGDAPVADSRRSASFSREGALRYKYRAVHASRSHSTSHSTPHLAMSRLPPPGTLDGGVQHLHTIPFAAAVPRATATR